MNRILLTLALSPFLLAACSSGNGDSGSGGGTGTISLSVTDVPFAYDVIDEATITVDRITVAPGANATSGFTTLYEGAPITMDLFSLRDGVTMDLVDSPLPAGDYRQFRLHVTSARLVLTNGNVYTTDDDTIHLTSQDTSGFKVFVSPPIHISDGETEEVLLDFDLSQTFLPIPAADALTATSYNLLPVVHVTNLGAVGGIQGVVTFDDGGGPLPVEDATVYVFHPGQTDPEDSVASTGTNALGEYTVLAVAPGTYDVMAIHGVDTATVTGVVVVTGAVTTVDIALAAP